MSTQEILEGWNVLGRVEEQIFDIQAELYDRWYDEHPRIYQSEVSALEQFVPWEGVGLEVGVGTARFAAPLHVEYGIDPSPRMAAIAREREINVVIGKGESLPFCDHTFDFVLMATVLCFLQDLEETVKECHRVLKFQGSLTIAFIDRESPIGREYQEDPESHEIFQYAHFHTLEEVRSLLIKAEFSCHDVIQTIFEDYGPSPSGFVVLKAVKEGSCP